MMLSDPYASGVLVKEHHERLVAGLDGYARDAGIHPRWISTKLADVCAPDEMNYVRNFNVIRAEGQLQGLCFVRKTAEADPETHMFAIAGCLVRNFIRARVMTISTVL